MPDRNSRATSDVDVGWFNLRIIRAMQSSGRLRPTVECVANQESQATEKQPRAGCRPPGAIRLAHLPGDPAVSQGAARLLSAWQTSSRKSDESSSAATAGNCVRSGLRIVRAMQSSRRAGETAGRVALL
jgi:hypothetical protein